MNVTIEASERDYILENVFWYIEGTIVGLTAWVASLELRKDLGGIWYRIDSTGKRSIQIQNLFNFMKNSIRLQTNGPKINFWEVKNWDLNFIATSNIVGLSYMTFRNILGL